MHIIHARGHHCLFFPKFHCELNPIARVWGQAKRYTRAYCNYSIVGLRKAMVPALDSVDVDLIRNILERQEDTCVLIEKEKQQDKKLRRLLRSTNLTEECRGKNR